MAKTAKTRGMATDLARMAKIAKTRGIAKKYIADALGAKCMQRRKEMLKVLDALAEVTIDEMKNNRKFTIPGIVMMKTHYKAPRKAGKKIAFGKVIDVPAKDEYTVVKAFPASALKSQLV